MARIDLLLKRQVLAGAFTLGVLAFGGHQWYSVEDAVRPLTNCTQSTCTGKINGRTAIPSGTYEIRDTYSPRFHRNVLELIGVPGFQGIRIHPGNTAEDTEGCLILGFKRTGTGVTQSVAGITAFNIEVRRELAKGNRVFITIQN